MACVNLIAVWGTTVIVSRKGFPWAAEGLSADFEYGVAGGEFETCSLILAGTRVVTVLRCPASVIPRVSLR